MLEDVQIGEPIQVGPLTVWPLISAPGEARFEVCGASGLAEFDELERPAVQRISARNPLDTPLLIPSGWLVDGLQQARVVVDDVWLQPREVGRIQVACVERGRWSGRTSARIGGRAPATVLAAAWGLNPTTRQWEPKSRRTQDFVWSAVRRYEETSGPRPTSSLTQIMAEDLLRPDYFSDALASVDCLVLPRYAVGIAIQFYYTTFYVERFRCAGDVRTFLRATLRGLLMDFAATRRLESASGSRDPIPAIEASASCWPPDESQMTVRRLTDPDGREVHLLAIARDLYDLVA